jgi:hypothetical protein
MDYDNNEVWRLGYIKSLKAKQAAYDQLKAERAERDSIKLNKKMRMHGNDYDD